MSQCTANILLDSILKSNLPLFNRDLNRRCLDYMFSLRFSGSKFLIHLQRQFRARKQAGIYDGPFLWIYLRGYYFWKKAPS